MKTHCQPATPASTSAMQDSGIALKQHIELMEKQLEIERAQQEILCLKLQLQRQEGGGGK